jgi:hypothetical protein
MAAMSAGRRAGLAVCVALSATGCGHRQCDVVFFRRLHCVDPSRLVVSRGPIIAPPTAVPAAIHAAAPEAPAPAPAVAAPPPAPPLPEVPAVNAVYFAPGRAELSPGSKLTLGRIAEFLSAPRPSLQRSNRAGWTGAGSRALAPSRARRRARRNPTIGGCAR